MEDGSNESGRAAAVLLLVGTLASMLTASAGPQPRLRARR